MDLFIRKTDSPMGRFDVRLKMACGFSMSLVAIMVNSLWTLAIAAIIGMIFFILSRPNMFQIKLVLFSIGFIVWSLMISQGMFYNQYPRNVLFTLVEPNIFFREGIHIYQQGIYHGLTQSFRFIAMIFVGYAICFSTEPDRFMTGLLAMRVPFSLAFMSVMAIRFLPVIVNEFKTVHMAMRLKGYRLFRFGVIHSIKIEIASLRPIIIGTIHRSQEIALSILTRGFDIEGTRTSLREEHFNRYHWLIFIGILIFIGSLLFCKMMFWLYQNEVYYRTELRPLYTFVRNWL